VGKDDNICCQEQTQRSKKSLDHLVIGNIFPMS